MTGLSRRSSRFESCRSRSKIPLLTREFRAVGPVRRVRGTERLDGDSPVRRKEKPPLCGGFMELAGLEPATSWVRSRIRGFDLREWYPRICLFSREFRLTLYSSDTPFPPITVPGRVAYGLLALLPERATTQAQPTAPRLDVAAVHPGSPRTSSGMPSSGSSSHTQKAQNAAPQPRSRVHSGGGIWTISPTAAPSD
jgi:hypothetical protein